MNLAVLTGRVSANLAIRYTKREFRLPALILLSASLSVAMRKEIIRPIFSMS